MDNLKRIFVNQQDKWVLKEANGQIVKRLGSIDAYTLLDVLVVKQGNSYGLINKNGEWAVPCEYERPDQYYHPYHDREHPYEAIFLFDKHKKSWLADKNGVIVTSRGYDFIGVGSYDHDRFCGDAWNHLIEIGEYRPNPLNPNIQDTYTGLFDFKNMREVIPPDYTPGVPDINEIDHGIYSSGIPVLSKENGVLHCKLIDIQGRTLIPFEAGFTMISVPPHIEDKEYLFSAYKNGKWGYINIYGVVKIPCKYDYAGEFTYKYAVVGFLAEDMYTVRYGVIDHHNNVVVPFKFTQKPAIYKEDDEIRLSVEGVLTDYTLKAY